MSLEFCGYTYMHTCCDMCILYVHLQKTSETREGLQLPQQSSAWQAFERVMSSLRMVAQQHRSCKESLAGEEGGSVLGSE